MKRQDLNQQQKQVLTNVVAFLFAGNVIEVRGPNDYIQSLCFRMRGEDMPDIQGEESSDLCQSTQGGMYISDLPPSPSRPRAPEQRCWLGIGNLDEILTTLEDMGDVQQILEQFQVQKNFQAAFKSNAENSVIKMDLRPDVREQAPSPFQNLSRQSSQTSFPSSRPRG